MQNKTKFKIVKGKPFHATFVIKQPGSPLPVELDEATVGTLSMSTFGLNPEVIHMNIPLSLGSDEDRANGKMYFAMTAEETGVLPTDVAFGEDGFPLSPTVKALLEIQTSELGVIFATVPKIYVENMGL